MRHRKIGKTLRILNMQKGNKNHAGKNLCAEWIKMNIHP